MTIFIATQNRHYLQKTVSYITWVTITHTTNNALTYLQYDYLRYIIYVYNISFLK